MIELKHLQTIQAIEHYGSVNRAAEALFMTQSALSHQLKQLESQLELKLFERKTQPVQWTPAGEVLLRLAELVLPQVAQAKSNLQRIRSGNLGRLWLGVECHTCFEWLLPILRRYQQQFSDIEVDMVAQLVRPTLDALKKHEIDLVITSETEAEAGVQFAPLFEYEVVLAVSPEHWMATQAYCQPQDLATETLLTYPVNYNKLDIFKSFLWPAKIQPKAIRHSEMSLMILQWVEANKGVAALPVWLLDSQPEFNHLKRLRLGKSGVKAKLYAAIRQTEHPQPYLQAFIVQVREVMGYYSALS